MTDFIHEHPKNDPPRDAAPRAGQNAAEQAAPSPAPAAEETAVAEGGGQKRVYGYIFILFIVAFFLLLWSFLMNQRSNEEVLSELRGSAGTLQSTLDRNVALQQQVEALEKQMEKLTAENKSLENRLSDQEKLQEKLQSARDETDAASTVYYAALKASEEDYAAAAAQLADWDTKHLLSCIESYDAQLSHYAKADTQPELVRTRYDALVERLTELGYLTVEADGQLKTVENP